MRDYYDDRAKWDLIPEHMRNGIYNYVMHGSYMGSFLTAIFANDFMTAAGCADDQNQKSLFQYAMFLYNHVPSQCKGSYKAVDAWIEHSGMYGLEARKKIAQ